MLRHPLAVVCAAVALLASTAAGAADTLSREIDFANPAAVRSAIRQQCELQTIIPSAVALHSDVELVDGRGSLGLEISDAHGPGGWVFSGPKWVEVKGSLRRGGKTYSFRAKRYSAFDPFSGGTCGILAKCARALGEDVALWLANPVDGAELGDAK